MVVEGWQLGVVRNRSGDLRVRDAADGRRVIALVDAGKERVCKIALDREAEADLRSQLRPLPAPPPAPTMRYGVSVYGGAYQGV